MAQRNTSRKSVSKSAPAAKKPQARVAKHRGGNAKSGNAKAARAARVGRKHGRAQRRARRVVVLTSKGRWAFACAAQVQYANGMGSPVTEKMIRGSDAASAARRMLESLECAGTPVGIEGTEAPTLVITAKKVESINDRDYVNPDRYEKPKDAAKAGAAVFTPAKTVVVNKDGKPQRKWGREEARYVMWSNALSRAA